MSRNYSQRRKPRLSGKFHLVYSGERIDSNGSTLQLDTTQQNQGYARANQRLNEKHGSNKAQENSSRNKEKSKAWNQLWGLNIKHKIKHFLWKCLHSILPTNEENFRRTGKSDPVCRCCGEAPETLVKHPRHWNMPYFNAKPGNWGGKPFLLHGTVLKPTTGAFEMVETSAGCKVQTTRNKAH